MTVEGKDFGAVALMAASHDLTAPLVLLRQLSFQLDQQLSQTNPEAAGILEQMRLAIGRTFAVADQLTWATGEEALSLEPVQLTGLCQDIDIDLQPVQQEWHGRVDYELPRQKTVVAVGNYQALKTILIGFLTDALRYNQPNNQQTVSSDAAAKRAALSSHRSATGRIVRLRVMATKRGEVSLSIRDNGPGINLAKSLAMAQQPANINPTTSRPLMGSLNLLLADRLLRAMNGRILVHNHRQGGVTIEAILPESQQLTLWGGAYA